MTQVSRTVGSATSTDARLLLISASGQEPALTAMQRELDGMGTPYTTLVTSTTPLSASVLSDGSGHGFFSGVVLVGCGATSPNAAPTLPLLSEYQSTFGVRSACLFGHPDASLGLGAGSSLDTRTTPLTLTYTPAGAALFGWYATTTPLVIQGVDAAVAPATDASTTPLLVDPAGNAPVAVHRFSDGREMLILTFDQVTGSLHSRQLLCGLASWVSHGVYIGEKRAYLGAQVDDLFLGTVTRSGPVYRMSGADLTSVAAWQRQAQSGASALRLTFAFNGAEVSDSDDLTQAARLVGQEFLWVSHTFDHHRLDTADYARMTDELTRNDAVMQKYGFGPYDRASLVTPDISALENAQVMQASADFGITRIICDGSQTNCKGELPNTGLPNPLVPSLLMVPRIATNLYADVSNPVEWTDYYNALNATRLGHSLSIDDILDAESETLVGYMLDGNIDPWMFHQANLRLYDGTHSLLTDLLDRTLQKYEALRVLPILSATMEDTGQRMLERAQSATAGVSATIGPGQSITIRASAAARLPITGAAGPGAETYGSIVITRVNVPAGGEVTIPLAPQYPGSDGGSDASAPDGDGSAGSAASHRQSGCSCGIVDGGPGETGGLTFIALLALRLIRTRRRIRVYRELVSRWTRFPST